MGHIRLKHLPATRKWDGVGSLLARGAGADVVARASADAAEQALQVYGYAVEAPMAIWLAVGNGLFRRGAKLLRSSLSGFKAEPPRSKRPGRLRPT